MTIRHLKIFLQIYETQNVTRAAEQLHMTQPAVSRALQELERYYGVQLFERLNRRLSATEAGSRLYAQATHIVASFDQMEQELCQLGKAAPVRVGATVTLANFLLPNLARRFRDEHPQVPLYARVDNADHLLAALHRNRLDLALVETQITDPELCCAAIGSDALCLVACAGHPLLQQEAEPTAAQLNQWPLLLREPGSSTRIAVEQVFGQAGLAVQPAWESVNSRALAHAAAVGLGVAILPHKLVQDSEQQGMIATRPLTHLFPARQHSLVWHKDKYLSPSLRQFMALCTAAGPLYATSIYQK
jgi:DNA-binding transcriptional LysR family regulator